MELTVSQAAKLAGVTPRRLQQAAAAGDLPVQRVVGRTQLVDSAVLQAFLRLARSGRRWGGRTARAALDLLDHGDTGELAGSELARLRTRLRGMSAADIAYRLGGTANWYRYRSVDPRGSVAHRVRTTGPSLLAGPGLADQLGLLPGGSANLYGVVGDLTAAEAEFGLILDGEGDIFLAERSGDDGAGATLVDLFLFGDVRESAAAAGELERRAAAC
jgi:hypothetical protein